MKTKVTRTGEIIDITGGDAYTPEKVVTWLRSSGGSLHERLMKATAADLIEQSAPDAAR